MWPRRWCRCYGPLSSAGLGRGTCTGTCSAQRQGIRGCCSLQSAAACSCAGARPSCAAPPGALRATHCMPAAPTVPLNHTHTPHPLCLQTGLQQAKEALTASGVPAVDPSAVAPVVKTTEQAVTTAKPFIEQASCALGGRGSPLSSQLHPLPCGCSGHHISCRAATAVISCWAWAHPTRSAASRRAALPGAPAPAFTLCMPTPRRLPHPPPPAHFDRRPPTHPHTHTTTTPPHNRPAQAITFVTTTEPVLLGEYALGLVAAWYLTPPLLKVAAGALRGYAGDVTPAAALTAVESDVSWVVQGWASLNWGGAGPGGCGAAPCWAAAESTLRSRMARLEMRSQRPRGAALLPPFACRLGGCLGSLQKGSGALCSEAAVKWRTRPCFPAAGLCRHCGHPQPAREGGRRHPRPPQRMWVAAPAHPRTLQRGGSGCAHVMRVESSRLPSPCLRASVQAAVLACLPG